MSFDNQILIKRNRFKTIYRYCIYVEPYCLHPYCHITGSNISFYDIYISFSFILWFYFLQSLLNFSKTCSFYLNFIVLVMRKISHKYNENKKTEKKLNN
jgi:hypothetical protein